MQGTVVKVISSSFYVEVNKNIYICTQRGVLKKNKTLPLVGDKVIVDLNKKVIEKILPRINEIIRPPVANITKGIIVTSLKNPDFSTNLLDKLLVELEINKIKPVICLTKIDLCEMKDDLINTIDYYKKIGYTVLDNTNTTLIKQELKDETTVFIGQTGAGKSTLLNKLFPSTTRVVEIIEIDDMKVLDTPGFSSLSFLSYNLESVKNAFIEFKNFPCVYKDCNHDKEPECNLKKAVEENLVLKSR